MRDNTGNTWQFYDTDRGNKMTLATSVEVSPIKYSILRSTAPQRPSSHAAGVPFGVYNTDRAHKKTLVSEARDTRRFYAASFDSAAPRFSRPWSSPVTDAFYDVRKTCNSRPATVAHTLETTSQNYAILRSNYNRLRDWKIGEGADAIYEIDTGHKKTLYTAMLSSPIQYRSLLATPHALEVAGKPIKRSEHQMALGPGCYDYKWPHEMQVSEILPNRPLSSMMSGTPRFGQRRTGAGGLGSTWSQEKDAKAWTQKGYHMSKSEYLRPQYLPKSYKNKDSKDTSSFGS